MLYISSLLDTALRPQTYIIYFVIYIVKPLTWRPQLCHRLVFVTNPQLLMRSRFEIINYLKRLLAGFKVENLFYFCLKKKNLFSHLSSCFEKLLKLKEVSAEDSPRKDTSAVLCCAGSCTVASEHKSHRATPVLQCLK